jgi:hypothetical protein
VDRRGDRLVHGGEPHAERVEDEVLAALDRCRRDVLEAGLDDELGHLGCRP